MKAGRKYLIQITKVPSGEAPIEYRRAWVNLYLPGVYFRKSDEVGIVTKNPVPLRPVFAVLAEDALRAIKAKSEDAYSWLRENVSPYSEHLVFGADEARVIRRLRDQQN